MGPAPQIFTPKESSAILPGMAAARVPRGDEVAPPPYDWVDIPLGAGQEPNAMGYDGSLQWENTAISGATVERNVVRRKPGDTIQFISRPPWRP